MIDNHMNSRKQPTPGSEHIEIRERGLGLVGHFQCAVQTSIDIDASVERVWSILTANSAYRDWNPFIRELVGDLEVGRRLQVAVGGNDSDLLRFEVNITNCEAERELRWSSRYGVPGLIDTEHYFVLEENELGGIHLSHGENFWGLLVPQMVRPGIRDVATGFDAMNKALKDEAEAS